MAKLVAAVLVLVAAVIIALMLRDTTPPAVAPAAAPAVSPASPAASLPSSASSSAPAQPPPVQQVHATMQKQITLLARGDYDTFAKSFAVPVTRDQFELCRKRMKHAHLSPDWEMAEITQEQGRRVVRVSIFGKGMTAFRESENGYVADTVWCVPLW